MSAFETGPTGDIHKPVAGNRYLVTAIKACMEKTADEFLSDLYEWPCTSVVTSPTCWRR